MPLRHPGRTVQIAFNKPPHNALSLDSALERKMDFLSIGLVPGLMIAVGALGSLVSSVAVCALCVALEGK